MVEVGIPILCTKPWPSDTGTQCHSSERHPAFCLWPLLISQLDLHSPALIITTDKPLTLLCIWISISVILQAIPGLYRSVPGLVTMHCVSGWSHLTVLSTTSHQTHTHHPVCVCVCVCHSNYYWTGEGKTATSQSLHHSILECTMQQVWDSLKRLSS